MDPRRGQRSMGNALEGLVIFLLNSWGISALF